MPNKKNFVFFGDLKFDLQGHPRSKVIVSVTHQCLFEVPDVTLVPYFSLASSGSVMLSSDNRNIMDYWIFNARYCFEYVFDVIRY